MSNTYNIPFIGGYANGRRITSDRPVEYHQVIEFQPGDYTVPPQTFDEAGPAIKTHTYKLHWSTGGTPFYAPANGDPKDAIIALLDKYPPPPDPAKIEVPIGLLDAVLRQAGNPCPDLTPCHQLHNLLMQHYRNHPPE